LESSNDTTEDWRKWFRLPLRKLSNINSLAMPFVSKICPKGREQGRNGLWHCKRMEG
jgi:hypothetical protein